MLRTSAEVCRVGNHAAYLTEGGGAASDAGLRRFLPGALLVAEWPVAPA
ncbi:hypothetical protein [Pedococcus bigeumensis]|nr:hypothetical protein [Pedococcus bigeumensis]